ncbi:MAG: hypothetical protein RR101_15115 [Burkholderiaceae bacterium]
MTVSKSPRLQQTRWSQDTDPFTRQQLDDDAAARELLTAIDEQGATMANRPAAGKRGRLWTSLEDGAVFRDNGTAWTYIGGMRPFSLVKVWTDTQDPEAGWRITPGLAIDNFANDDRPLPSWLSTNVDGVDGQFRINGPGTWDILAKANFEVRGTPTGMHSVAATVTSDFGAIGEKVWSLFHNGPVPVIPGQPWSPSYEDGPNPTAPGYVDAVGGVRARIASENGIRFRARTFTTAVGGTGPRLYSVQVRIVRSA